MAEATLQVEGMTCNHCKMSVEKALRGLEGITAVAVDLAAKTARVTYDPAKVNLEAMKKAVIEAGYEVK
ncbi:Copper ion binding protein [Moorella glycerini]|uniref:Copper chaperone CopZ n=1 Tax=Neomoorella stamsii TaxID=1266720 RepID=A0A9X7P586_9FIRM|nr:MULTISPECIES: copper ion binding protein [Moorella]PRR70647.1 Copper chaperone CopZ [Moorella stamsii]CEP68004.1 Copper ion binding protein [Moorella glycerini]